MNSVKDILQNAYTRLLSSDIGVPETFLVEGEELETARKILSDCAIILVILDRLELTNYENES